MSLSNNKKKANNTAIRISKPDGHTGGAKERQGNNFGKESFRSKVPSKAFRAGFDNIDWSKK